MKCTGRRLAAVLLLLGAALAASPGLAEAARPMSRAAASNIQIVYDEPSSDVFRPIYQRLKELRVLERLQRFLAPLRLTRDLLVKTAECADPPPGRAYAYVPYQPGQPVIICYNYVKLIEDLAPDASPEPANYKIVGQALVNREMALVGPFVQEVLHDVALAVIEILDVPVWGRVEDAADNISALLMMQFGAEVALKTVLGSAYFLNAVNQLVISKKDAGGNPVSSYTLAYLGDIRPPMLQRYYNLLCMAVGKDVVLFSSLVALNREPSTFELSWNKVTACQSEYRQVADGFRATILDKYVDPALLKEVRATDWLKAP
jgi:hypothetical protein